MKETNVKKLLDKYFEGFTSCEEERQLRKLFTQGHVPEELRIYRPMFICFDEEIENAKPKIKTSIRHRLNTRYIWIGIAASILIILGAGYNGLLRQDTNYVIINGEKYSDVHMAKQQAKEAFEAVSFSKEEVADELIPQDMKEKL